MPGGLENRLADFLIAEPSSVVPVSQTSLLVSTWVATSLAAIFTALRSWLQFRHNKRWYANDYLLGVAFLLHIALSVTISCAAPNLYDGLNAVAKAVAMNEAIVGFLQPTFLKYQFSALILLWTALWTVKIAMLSFYLRLYNAVKSKAQIFWWIIFSITIATWIVSIVLLVIACDPPLELFDPDAFVKPKSIVGFNRAFHFAAISDILTDIMTMLVPLPLLRILQLPRTQKVILLLIFLTPIFAIIFAILSLVFDSIKTFGPTINPIRFFLYSTLEVSLFIITACLPSLRLYFKARQDSLSNGRQKTVQSQSKDLTHLSIDWGAMVLQPITKSKARPIRESISMDHILSPRSPDFDNYERSNFSHENIGHAM